MSVPDQKTCTMISRILFKLSRNDIDKAIGKSEVTLLNPQSYRTAAWFIPIVSGIPLHFTPDIILIAIRSLEVKILHPKTGKTFLSAGRDIP